MPAFLNINGEEVDGVGKKKGGGREELKGEEEEKLQ